MPLNVAKDRLQVATIKLKSVYHAHADDPVDNRKQERKRLLSWSYWLFLNGWKRREMKGSAQNSHQTDLVTNGGEDDGRNDIHEMTLSQIESPFPLTSVWDRFLPVLANVRHIIKEWMEALYSGLQLSSTRKRNDFVCDSRLYGTLETHNTPVCHTQIFSYIETITLIIDWEETALIGCPGCLMGWQ